MTFSRSHHSPRNSECHTKTPKNQECHKHEDFHNEHDMKNNIVVTHSKWNFINKTGSLWTLYLEFHNEIKVFLVAMEILKKDF